MVEKSNSNMNALSKNLFPKTMRFSEAYFDVNKEDNRVSLPNERVVSVVLVKKNLDSATVVNDKKGETR